MALCSCSREGGQEEAFRLRTERQLDLALQTFK